VIGLTGGEKLQQERQMRISELKGREVVSVAGGNTGGLRGLIDKQVIPFAALEGIGDAAITAPSKEQLQPLEHNLALFTLPRASDLHPPVLTPKGDRVGTVDDLEFDPQTGAITGVVVDPAEGYKSPYGGKQCVEIRRVLAMSTQNVIVEEQAIPEVPRTSDAAPGSRRNAVG
jgi:sporulation protein YlmC with PRC-barrel domain